MTVRVNKPSFNIREKLSELGRKFGLKGSELAAAETVQEAREIVSAGRKNLIINGAMEVAQRATSATGVGAAFSYYTLDRYQFRSSGHGGRYTMSQSATNPGEGFSKSLKFEVTTADSSVASAEYAGFSTRFEGQDVQQLAFGSSKAKPLTLSFWVRSNVTGTYSVFFANWWSSTGRLINRTFTINRSNTWEKKVLTIPGDTDSNNSIPENNSAGMEIGWTFTSGTTYNDGSDGSVWHNSSSAGKRHYGHEVNFADTVGNTFYITGIQLEVGRNATDFEHRSYGEELKLCERYFEKIWQNNNTASPHSGGDGYNTISPGVHNGSHGYYVWKFRTQKRIRPSLDHAGKFRVFGASSIQNLTFNEFYSPGIDAARLRVGHSGSAGDAFILEFDGGNSSNGYISASAEL